MGLRIHPDRRPAGARKWLVVMSLGLLLALFPGLLVQEALPGQPGMRQGGEPAFCSSSAAPGKFLVASRRLKDPNFSETVVLLLAYGEQGAMGLIINRPTPLRLASLLPEIEGIQERADPLYNGGPVEGNRLFVLVRSSKTIEGGDRLFADVYVSSSRAVLEQVATGQAGQQFRVYAGYAGWVPGQLDREIHLGAWHLAPADAETVFKAEAAEIWPELIQRSTAQWVKRWLD